MSEKIKTKESRELDLSKKTLEKLVKICLIFGIIVISGFIIYHILLPEQGFVSFGLLNSDKKAGNYPTNASINKDIYFYATVENYLGIDISFRLKIYQGDNQTLIRPTGVTNANLNQTTPKYMLANNQKWISDTPYNISFSQIGSNQTIVVELWQFTTGSNEKFYDILWLRLNITA
jgi:uncharacterized membrane protein